MLRYRVYNHKGETFRTYVAQILGPDPNYILKRRFLHSYVSSNSRFKTFTCVLEDGIYELMVKRFDEETGDCVEKERKWLLVIDGCMKLYEEEAMNAQYALFVAFNLRHGEVA